MVLFSVMPVFAGTGSMSVISGKSFQIVYDAKDVKILDVQPNTSLSELLTSVQVSSPVASLDLTMPRDLIDSKDKNGNDVPFLIVADGTLINAVEKNSSSTARTISVGLTPDMKEIEIIGTYLAGGETTQNPMSVPTTPTPAPVQPVPQPTPTPTPTPQPPPNEIAPLTHPTIPSKPTNMTRENIFIQKNIVDLVSKIPYISTSLTKASIIDYAVIGSIALIVVIVIASAGRTRSHKLAQKRSQS